MNEEIERAAAAPKPGGASGEAAGPQAVPRCPWCSAVLTKAAATTCPACGATLVDSGDAAIDAVPGVTAVSPDLEARARRFELPRRRGLRGLFGGDDTPATEEPPPAPPSALAPPDPEVRREMLRLELEAAVANAQGEVAALQAEALPDEDAGPS
ncbi:MAG TPA: hypothetical protein VF763_05175 [Candidatus Limnocylindrales bacterium]